MKKEELSKEATTKVDSRCYPSQQFDQIELGVGYSSDKTLARYFDASRSTIWKWTREGKLPKPIKLTAGATRWKNAAVKAYSVRLRATLND